jgi:alpha-glucosidase
LHAASVLETTQLSLNPALEELPRLDAASLRHALATLPPIRAGHTIVLQTDSIERPRSFDRYGSGSDDIELAKALAAALLTSPGAPLLYFGQELGMATTPAPGSSAKPGPGDPTPMQWGDQRGFSSGVPWIDMGRNTATANVAMEDQDRYSLLNWYRRLTALHHANSVLREGSADVLQVSNAAVVAWIRRTKTGAPVVVLCNLSAHPVALSIAAELRRLAVPTGTGVMHTLATSSEPTVLASTATEQADPANDAPVSINSISLPPYGVYLGELRGQAGLETMPSPARPRARSRSGR